MVTSPFKTGEFTKSYRIYSRLNAYIYNIIYIIYIYIYIYLCHGQKTDLTSKLGWFNGIFPGDIGDRPAALVKGWITWMISSANLADEHPLVHGSGSPASIYRPSPSDAVHQLPSRASAETSIFGSPKAQRGYPMLKDLRNMGYLTIFHG